MSQSVSVENGSTIYVLWLQLSEENNYWKQIPNQLIEYSLDCTSPDNEQKLSFPVNPCIQYTINFDFLYFTPVASAYMEIIQIVYEQCLPDP